MKLYIENPKDSDRCIIILKALIGNENLSVEGDGKACVVADETGIYFLDRYDLTGTEIVEYPVVEEGEEIIHYRSKRRETVKGTALLKTERGWEDCVIYENGNGMTFVRERKDFMEAFAGIKKNRGH